MTLREKLISLVGRTGITAREALKSLSSSNIQVYLLKDYSDKYGITSYVEVSTIKSYSETLEITSYSEKTNLQDVTECLC